MDRESAEAELRGYKRGLEAAAEIAEKIAQPTEKAIELYGVHGPHRSAAETARRIAACCRALQGT